MGGLFFEVELDVPTKYIQSTPMIFRTSCDPKNLHLLQRRKRKRPPSSTGGGQEMTCRAPAGVAASSGTVRWSETR